MADEILGIRATVKTGELDAGIKSSASVVEGAVSKMGTAFSSLFRGVTESMGGIVRSVEQGTAKANRSLSGLDEKIEATAAHAQLSAKGVGSAFGGLAGILGASVAVTMFAEFFQQASEGILVLRNMSQETGIAVDELSALQHVANLTDVAFENIGLGLKKLSKEMDGATEKGSEQEKTFARLGITTNGWANTMPPALDVMLKVADRFKGMKDGAEKAALAQELFGRGGIRLIPMLNQGSEGIRAMMQEARDLGAVLDDKTVEAVASFDDSTDRLTARLKGFLYPALVGLIDLLKRVWVVVELGKFVFMSLWDIIKGTVANMLLSVTTLFKAFTQAIHGDFAGAWKTAKAGVKEFQDQNEKTFDSIVDRAAEAQRAVEQLFGTSTKKKSGGDTEIGDKKPTTDKTVDMWEDALNKIKIADETFKQNAIAREYEFWAEKLKLTEKGSDNERKVRAKVASLKDQLERDQLRKSLAALELEMAALDKHSEKRIAVARKEADQIKKEYGAESAEYLAAQKHIVDITRDVEEEKKRLREKGVEDQLKLNEIEEQRAQEKADGELERERILMEASLNRTHASANARLRAEADYENKSYAIKAAAINKRRTLLEAAHAADPANPKYIEQLAKLNAQIEKEEQQHNNKILQLDQQHVTKKKQIFDGVFGAMSRAFSGTVQAVIMGTKTISQAIADMGIAILMSFVDVLAQMLIQWVTTKMAMLIFGKSVDKSSASSSIAASAAEGGAAAGASVAHIPFVGWSMAPAVAASTYGLLMGFQGLSMISAAGGEERVGKDGAMYELHKDEAVLPAHIADQWRNGGGAKITYAPVIQALDSRGVSRVLRRERRTVAATLRGILRDRVGAR